jgi:hypothetical protein
MTTKKYISLTDKFQQLSTDLLQATTELLDNCDAGVKIEETQELALDVTPVFESIISELEELKAKLEQIQEIDYVNEDDNDEDDDNDLEDEDDDIEIEDEDEEEEVVVKKKK